MISFYYPGHYHFTFSMCISVNIKFPTCFDSTRVYEPPDPPGYFDGHVWPMYLKHRRELEDIEGEIGKCPFSLRGRPLTCHCQKVHKIRKEYYIIKETLSCSTLGSRLPQQALLASARLSMALVNSVLTSRWSFVQ